MLNISFINPFHSTKVIETIADVPIEGDWLEQLEMSDRSLNQPYKLDITLNWRFPYFEELIRTPDQFGFKITTDNLSLAFIPDGGDSRLTQDGKFEMTLYSSVNKLKTENNLIFVDYPDISLATFLSYLNTNYVFTPISSDRNIKIKGDFWSEYDMMDEAINYVKAFDWRENGLLTFGGGVTKTQIVYGDFGYDGATYYNNTGDKSFMPLVAKNNTDFDSSIDLDVVKLNKITKHYKYGVPNRFVVMVDTGSGVNLNSSYNLRPDLVQNPNPDFPFGSFVNQAGQTFWYITNPLVSQLPIRTENLTININSASENFYSNDFTTLDSAQIAYSQAINTIKSKAVGNYFSIDETTIKKLVLPGIETQVNYKKVVKLNDKRSLTLFDIDETFIQSNFESINLLKITN